MSLAGPWSTPSVPARRTTYRDDSHDNPCSCHHARCTVCREECLHAAGFKDIFRGVKAAEGERALALLPQLLSELDARDDVVDAWVLRGASAGRDVGVRVKREETV